LETGKKRFVPLWIQVTADIVPVFNGFVALISAKFELDALLQQLKI